MFITPKPCVLCNRSPDEGVIFGHLPERYARSEVTTICPNCFNTIRAIEQTNEDMGVERFITQCEINQFINKFAASIPRYVEVDQPITVGFSIGFVLYLLVVILCSIICVVNFL